MSDAVALERPKGRTAVLLLSIFPSNVGRLPASNVASAGFQTSAATPTSTIRGITRERVIRQEFSQQL
jgi:hypothetical protein